MTGASSRLIAPGHESVPVSSAPGRRFTRAATRTPDSLPDPTRAAGSPDPAMPFDHVVVVMMENHSFDNLLGALSQVGQREADGLTFGPFGRQLCAVRASRSGGGGFALRPPGRGHRVVHDHTSVLATIEAKWNLPALTYRDANAATVLDFLDPQVPAFRDPPTLARPPLWGPSGPRI